MSGWNLPDGVRQSDLDRYLDGVPSEPWVCPGCNDVVSGGETCCRIRTCECGNECAGAGYSQMSESWWCCVCVANAAPTMKPSCDWCRMCERRSE